jgi:hypothetical protein
VPANFLVIDFTPDALPGETQNQSFASAFALRDAYGRPPAFLDMNGDRAVNGTDADIAARQVVSRVAQRLSGFNVNVVWGDLWQDTGLGKAWLNWGLQRPGDQVFSLYVGGWNSVDPQAPPGATGVGMQGPVGYNNEWYGLVWTSTQVVNMASGIGQPTASYFVESTSATVVHEFGHLVGLGHVQGNPPDWNFNVMNYWVGTNYPQYARVPNVTYNNIDLLDVYQRRGTGTQNPAVELAQSLAGQPGAPASFHISYTTHRPAGSFMHYVVPPTEGGDDHDHDHGHDTAVAALTADGTGGSTGNDTPTPVAVRTTRPLGGYGLTGHGTDAGVEALSAGTSRQTDRSPLPSPRLAPASTSRLDESLIAALAPIVVSGPTLDVA